MSRIFTLGIATMVVAEGMLVTLAPVVAVVFAMVFLAASGHLWCRRTRGRRPVANRRAWPVPDHAAATLRRVA